MEHKDDPVLSEKVYDQILEMILTQQIRCGEKISEEKITQMLGVSRTPIREAIRRLASEGLVNLYPKRFAEVISFDDGSIRHLGTIRIALDTLAGQLAILYGSNADFMKLRHIAEQCYAAGQRGDTFGRIRLDCDFHLMLAEIARNPILIKFQKELYMRVYLVLATRDVGVEEGLRRIKGHNAIIEGLLARDEEAVINSIHDHLSMFYQVDVPSPAVPKMQFEFS